MRDILDELVLLLEQNGITVRREADAGAGLCVIKGQTVVFIDNSAPTVEMAEICGRAVCKNIDIENIYIKPQIREFLEKYCIQTD